MTDDVKRCECGNPISPSEPPETKCDWCLNPECEILIEIEGVAAGAFIGMCPADNRPVFRSLFAGTIYHTTEDR